MNDKRIDAYIEKSADFARPILIHLRELIHTACPEVRETIKWGMPAFEYKGPLCSMAAFKAHATFGFWKTSLMKDPQKFFTEENHTAMGSFGRITSLADLPKDSILTKYLKEATQLNESGIGVSKKTASKKKDLTVPAYFLTALKGNKQAWKTYETFSYTNKKEYLEWVTEAKTEPTRLERLKTAIEWMAQGKIRNWKYIKE